MIIKGGYYYDFYKKTGRDIIPKGNILFVLSAGHTKLLSIPCVKTVYFSRKDYQLIYVNNGVLYYYDKNGTKHTANKGSFVLYKPSEYQEYILYKNDETDIYWCHFGGNFAEVLLKKYNLFDKRVISLKPKEEYNKLYTNMRINLENKSKYFAELGSLYLQELMVMIADEINSQNETESFPASYLTALNYLNKNYYEKISVEELSKIATVNEKTVTRHFLKYQGQTPIKYLNNLRIEKAKTLLLQTSYKINEISLAVGFQDALYFSTLFKSLNGVSPREFRNTHK